MIFKLIFKLYYMHYKWEMFIVNFHNILTRVDWDKKIITSEIFYHRRCASFRLIKTNKIWCEPTYLQPTWCYIITQHYICYNIWYLNSVGICYYLWTCISHLCSVLCNVNTTGICSILMHIFFLRTYTYFINILDFPEYYSPDVWMVVEWRTQGESPLNQIFYAKNSFFFGLSDVPHLNESKVTKNTIPSQSLRENFRDYYIITYVPIISNFFNRMRMSLFIYKSISLPSSDNG